MARKVSPGEPIRPHMTASWFNSTLNKPQVPKLPRPTDLRLHNEDSAVFVPSEDYPVADRFTAVAPIDRIDTDYPSYQVRAASVDKESINRYNWVVAQQEMAEDYPDGQVVYFGLTYAKVQILDGSHPCVDINLSTKELVSSWSGKGVLLIPNVSVGGFSLIAISGLTAGAWVGRTTSTISARSGLQLGSGTVDLYRSDVSGLMSLNGDSMTVYNTQLGSVASGQVVQIKGWDVPLIDVGPCTLEDDSSSSNSGSL